MKEKKGRVIYSYVLILNVLLGIIAFSHLVSAQFVSDGFTSDGLGDADLQGSSTPTPTTGSGGASSSPSPSTSLGGGSSGSSIGSSGGSSGGGIGGFGGTDPTARTFAGPGGSSFGGGGGFGGSTGVPGSQFGFSQGGAGSCPGGVCGAPTGGSSGAAFGGGFGGGAPQGAGGGFPGGGGQIIRGQGSGPGGTGGFGGGSTGGFGGGAGGGGFPQGGSGVVQGGGGGIPQQGGVGGGIPQGAGGVPQGGFVDPQTGQYYPPQTGPAGFPGGQTYGYGGYGGPQAGLSNFFNGNLIGSLSAAAGIGGLGATLGAFAGGEDGGMWGFISGFAGAMTYQLAKAAGLGGLSSAALGLGVAALIFILTYKKKEQERVDFHCFPYQPPLGGRDCELCNDYEGCGEYTCRSLGQACDIVNTEGEDALCVWKNPHDTNSPIIKMTNITKGHTFSPDVTRPTGTGITIEREDAKCIKAFTPLEFTFTTRDKRSGLGEPSQCKVDVNLTSATADDPRSAFENMQFYVGGDSTFKYNHTETLALPGPDNVNNEAPELKNDGTYTLHVRCQDANGNFNQDAYTISFCVDPGPDTTPPLIIDTNIPSGNPVQFNQTSLDLEVYVNEPSECKWSREDRRFDLMEQDMDCDTQLFQINNENSYTCRTTLTGLEDRKENTYYFRCKDQPLAEEGDRNINKQSYQYTVQGTQPITILSVGPEEGTIISGATDVLPVTLTIETDNGFRNGEAICYYSRTGNEEDFLQFRDSNTTNMHQQRQDLSPGLYTYFYKCVDFAGNAAYNQTTFTVLTDRFGPEVVRFYRESGQLKLTTSENAECSYSPIDCNFEIEDGIQMSTIDFVDHTVEWDTSFNYHIRCMDRHGNQPNPDICSIIIRPSEQERAEELLL